MHLTNCGMVTPTISSCGNLQPPWSLKTRWYRQPLRARRHGASSGSAWHLQMLKGVVFSPVEKAGFFVPSLSVRSETWEKSHVIPKACSLRACSLWHEHCHCVLKKWREFKKSSLRFLLNVCFTEGNLISFFVLGLRVWSFGVFQMTSGSKGSSCTHMFP